MTGEQVLRSMTSPVQLNQVRLSGQVLTNKTQSALPAIISQDLCVVPIVAIDFSKGNLTYDHNESLHAMGSYRELIHAVAWSFTHVTNLAMFGYGAKMTQYMKYTSSLFPLTKHIRNPFTPN